MKRNIRVFLLGLAFLMQSVGIVSKGETDDQSPSKNGLLAKTFFLTGAVGGMYGGYNAAVALCNRITSEKIQQSLIFSAKNTQGIVSKMRTFFSNNRELLSDPYTWGIAGAIMTGVLSAKYLYSVTPAGCINEYKELFGLQSDSDLNNFQPTNAVNIVASAKSNGWTFLGWRTYSYHKMVDYLSALSFRCSIANKIFGNNNNSNDLMTIIKHIEHMKNIIMKSDLYKTETDQMKASAQEKLAEAAQLSAIAQHNDLASLLRNKIYSTLWNYTGTGLLGLTALFVAYKVCA